MNRAEQLNQQLKKKEETVSIFII